MQLSSRIQWTLVRVRLKIPARLVAKGSRISAARTFGRKSLLGVLYHGASQLTRVLARISVGTRD